MGNGFFVGELLQGHHTDLTVTGGRFVHFPGIPDLMQVSFFQIEQILLHDY